MPTFPGPNKHTLNLYDGLLNGFTNGVFYVLVVECLLLNLNKENYNNLFLITVTIFPIYNYLKGNIYNYLKGKFNSYYHI